MSSATIVAAFWDRVANSGAAPALHVPDCGNYRTVSWMELADDVLRMTAVFADWDISPGDRIVLVSPNRYEWIVADLAMQSCRAVHVPVHAALSGQQIAYQIIDSGAKAVILAGADHLDRLRPQFDRLPTELHWLTFDGAQSLSSAALPRWRDALTRVNPATGEANRDAAIRHASPEDLATILYTSGTTGEPKGVMLNQRNLFSNAQASLTCWDHSPADVRLTWLPLSHIFARTCDLYTWILSGIQLVLAEAPERVIANCSQWRPTHMNGVPYFWEKVQRSLIEQGRADEPGALQQMFGGRLRVCISGGAALPRHVESFYQERGLLLVQGYGLTESSPVITTGTAKRHKLGTVGPPIPGVDVRIADDGEILTRGPHVMAGYWKKPEATDAVLKDGWLHTGDVGVLDEEGFLTITGRKKELIVTSGGKNVAPVLLEALLTADDLIEQAVVIGDGRNFLTALIVPNPMALRSEIAGRSIAVSSAAEALAHPEVRAMYQERIAARLAEVSYYEQVQDFVLLDRGLGVEHGELTPTLKLRRNAIYANFAERIEAMYAK